MKKLLSLTLIMLIILPFTACSSAHSVDEILPRLRELVEESYQINEIFFGKGLPTYPRVEKLTDKPFSYDSTNDIYYLMFEDEKLGDMCMYYDKESSGYRFLRILPDDGNDVNGDLVYTDEEGKEFVNRLMACLEVIDEKNRIFRAAGIDLTIDSSSPLQKLMAKRGVLE